jgi:alkylation response protein AidB-like acyl-CoA dehydrogenase
MDLTHTPEHLAFRDELRSWLAVNRHEPAETDDPAAELAAMERWIDLLREGRWLGVHWPKEHGGRGASPTESAMFFEELGRHRQPLPWNILGILLAGPTLMEWGTQEQKDRHLPAILEGERWCQGFSEPGSGSDLASLSTKAVRDGDEWVVTGQKIWTSLSRDAKWCMLLARTNPDVKKHAGITYFILDMEQPGVEVRPMKQMTGDAEFSETFLTEARIPHANVVGGVDNGWKVSLATLAHERSGPIAYNLASVRVRLDDLIALSAERGLLDDPLVADRLADLHVRAELMRQTARRATAGLEKRGKSGPEGSVAKLMVTAMYQEVTQAAADLLPETLTGGTPWSWDLLRARGRSIEGGTREIQKNVIAQRVLGLPRAA